MAEVALLASAQERPRFGQRFGNAGDVQQPAFECAGKRAERI